MSLNGPKKAIWGVFRDVQSQPDSTNVLKNGLFIMFFISYAPRDPTYPT